VTRRSRQCDTAELSAACPSQKDEPVPVTALCASKGGRADVAVLAHSQQPARSQLPLSLHLPPPRRRHFPYRNASCGCSGPQPAACPRALGCQQRAATARRCAISNNYYKLMTIIANRNSAPVCYRLRQGSGEAAIACCNNAATACCNSAATALCCDWAPARRRSRLASSSSPGPPGDPCKP
jgi:hypothetical protein